MIIYAIMHRCLECWTDVLEREPHYQSFYVHQEHAETAANRLNAQFTPQCVFTVEEQPVNEE